MVGGCKVAPFAGSVFAVELALGLHTVLVVGFLGTLVRYLAAGLGLGFVLAPVAGPGSVRVPAVAAVLDFVLVLVLVLFVEHVVHGSQVVCRIAV